MQFNFNWKRILAIAGVSFYKLWFALHEGTIRAPQVIGFLQQLQVRIGKKLLLVWDGLRPHTSRAVQGFLANWAERSGWNDCRRMHPS